MPQGFLVNCRKRLLAEIRLLRVQRVVISFAEYPRRPVRFLLLKGAPRMTQKRAINRLSARTMNGITKPGLHADGGNLYLYIGPGGARSWSFLYKNRTTRRNVNMGLGPAPGAAKHGISLADARRRAEETRRLLWAGIDPLADKRAARAGATVEAFGTFADSYVENAAKGFKSETHIGQWKVSVEVHAASLRPLRLDVIDTDAILRVLEPLWEKTPETAKRTQGRLERILDAARAKGLRTGENPARWKGHLKELLGGRKKIKAHHAALPYQDVPAFMKELRALRSVSAKALDFTILCAARTSETLGATWSEIDLAEKLWTIPAERMKAGREHRVPLSDDAIAILKSIMPPKPQALGFVFPGAKKDTPLSGMSMLQALRGIRPGFTVHGFRSAFSDWCGDCTTFSEETREFALAHVKGDRAEAAYRRGTALEKRRELMKAWAEYLAAK